jgi:hypothetical protein
MRWKNFGEKLNTPLATKGPLWPSCSGRLLPGRMVCLKVMQGPNGRTLICFAKPSTGMSGSTCIWTRLPFDATSASSHVGCAAPTWPRATPLLPNRDVRSLLCPTPIPLHWQRPSVRSSLACTQCTQLSSCARRPSLVRMDALPALGEMIQQNVGGERCNTRSTFETSKYNGCNIRLKAVETLETCLWNT